MVQVIQKTVETEVFRAKWCLLLVSEDGENLVLEYLPTVTGTPEVVLHREVVTRSMKVAEAKGWNPAGCWWEILQEMESNGPEKLRWWELVMRFEFGRAVEIISGGYQVKFETPTTVG